MYSPSTGDDVGKGDWGRDEIRARLGPSQLRLALGQQLLAQDEQTRAAPDDAVP